MLANSKAFKVSHSSKTETKGIWMSTVVQKQFIDAEEVSIIMIDTEGLGESGVNKN